MAHIQVNYYNKISVALPYDALHMRTRTELWDEFFLKSKARTQVYTIYYDTIFFNSIQYHIIINNIIPNDTEQYKYSTIYFLLYDSMQYQFIFYKDVSYDTLYKGCFFLLLQSHLVKFHEEGTGWCNALITQYCFFNFES